MSDLVSAFQADLIGRPCRIERREQDWAFDLGQGWDIAVSCHWRLVSNEGIAVTDEDDGQWFGLSEPVNSAARANDLIEGATIMSAEVDRLTADLSLSFSNGFRLDLIANSAGYENWQCSYSTGDGSGTAIALGGGELVFM